MANIKNNTVTTSILLPFHNAEATIAEALESVHKQTDPDWECVLVHDGSTDGGPAVANAFAAADSRFRILQPGRVGLIAALNAGLAECRGCFIARMDADDRMLPGRLEAQRKLLTENPDVVLAGCLVRTFSDGGAPPPGGMLEYERWLNSVVSPDDIEQHRMVDIVEASFDVAFDEPYCPFPRSLHLSES